MKQVKSGGLTFTRLFLKFINSYSICGIKMKKTVKCQDSTVSQLK